MMLDFLFFPNYDESSRPPPIEGKLYNKTLYIEGSSISSTNLFSFDPYKSSSLYSKQTKTLLVTQPIPPPPKQNGHHTSPILDVKVPSDANRILVTNEVRPKNQTFDMVVNSLLDDADDESSDEDEDFDPDESDPAEERGSDEERDEYGETESEDDTQPLDEHENENKRRADLESEQQSKKPKLDEEDVQ